jgi:hypothetical protein
MLCPHILQGSLGLVNTLMIQDTVALPEREGVLTDADRRGLTPVFHANMTPYGEALPRLALRDGLPYRGRGAHTLHVRRPDRPAGVSE